MKLDSAEFIFGDHKVTFIGSQIVIYANAGGRWEIVRQLENRWVSRVREDEGVMGRAHKPRVTDAANLLRSMLACTSK